jgi:hypothetical protein
MKNKQKSGSYEIKSKKERANILMNFVQGDFQLTYFLYREFIEITTIKVDCMKELRTIHK